MQTTDFEIITDENRFPVKLRVKGEVATNETVEIKFTGKWREALRKAMEERATGHMLKCMKFHTDNDYIQKCLENSDLRTRLKFDVMLHIAETMKRELKSHIKLLPVIFDGEFSKDEMTAYLGMVHDQYHGKTDTLYHQARFKYLIQTMYDRVDEIIPPGNPAGNKKDNGSIGREVQGDDENTV